MAESLQAQPILDDVPAPRGPAVDGMLPQIVPGEVDFSPGDVEENDIDGWRTHQWRMTKGGENIYVEGGTIIYGDIAIQVAEHSFAMPESEWDVWCKITLLPSGEPVEGIIENGSLDVGPPADTLTENYRRLAEYFNNHWQAPAAFYGEVRQLQFEPIRLDENSDSEPHQWKVTRGAVVDGAPQIEVAGGWLTTQTTFTETWVADETLLAVTGQVMLRVERDDATRAMLSTAILMEPAAGLPTDDYTYQYIPLADVVVVDGVVTSILQRKFEDIQIFEDLAPINGEYYLVPIAMNGRGPYQLPSP